MANLQLLGVDSLQVLKLSGIETIEGKTAYQYAQDGVILALKKSLS